MIREKIIAKQGEKKMISKDHIMNKKKSILVLERRGVQMWLFCLFYLQFSLEINK